MILTLIFIWGAVTSFSHWGRNTANYLPAWSVHNVVFFLVLCVRQKKKKKKKQNWSTAELLFAAAAITVYNNGMLQVSFLCASCCHGCTETGPLKAMHAVRCEHAQSEREQQQQLLQQVRRCCRSRWTREVQHFCLSAQLIRVRLLLFQPEFYMSMLPSPWTWPVKAGMLAEASSFSPTSTRTTRKAGPGRESGSPGIRRPAAADVS